jgi:hypothetical protein
MIHTSTLATLDTLRKDTRHLLNEFDAADALAVYYTLYHEPKRTTLYVNRNGGVEPDGFLTKCITGIDLFRPLVTLRLRGSEALPALLSAALTPGHPCMLVIPTSYLDRVKPYLALTAVSQTHIMRLETERYRPEMNALITHISDPAGNPRVEMRQRSRVIAAAGVNWRSPLFAEIFVTVEEAHRMRGLGRAVVNALVGDLLKLKLMPLYSVNPDNDPSLALAEAVGFVDTGGREVMAQAVRIIDGDR